MKFWTSRPLQITRTSTPKSRSLSNILDQSQELGVASRILTATGSQDSSPDMAEAAKASSDDTRDDLAWQAYCNPSSPGGGQVGHAAYASPASAGIDQGDISSSVDRGSVAGGAEVGGTKVKVANYPFATIPSIEQEIDDGLADAGGGAVLSGKVMGGFVDIGAMGASTSTGLVAITDNKIQILGSAQTDQFGVSRQLARFTSACTPALDLNISHADTHFGGGMRAVVALGHSTTFEKYVAVDDLARMLRKRDTVFKPLIEAASAVGLMAGIKMPSLSDLAADMGSIDAMRPGESATWLSSRLLMLGVSAGGMGIRATAQVSTQNSSMYKLERQEKDSVTLTVRPGKVDGLRLSLDVKLLGELSVDAIGTAGMQRAWTFDLNYMSSRHALSNALKGELPGFVLPLANTGEGFTTAWRALCLSSAEALPFGVANYGTEFVSTLSKGASLSGFKLPSLLGESSLGISRQNIAAVYGRVDEDGATLTLSHENSRRTDLLSIGSLKESDTTGLISAVSIGPKGERIVTPKEITTSLRRETFSSSKYGRKKLTKSLDEVSPIALPLHSIQPSRRYAVDIAMSMSVDSFKKARQMTASDIQSLAKQNALPFRSLLLTHTVLMRALSRGSEEAMIEALGQISAQKHVGMLCLSCLASDVKRSVGVMNDDHDKMLSDFLKAETFALGCKTVAQAQDVVKRADKLQKKIEKSIKELSGDAALHLIDADEQERRMKFMELLRDETVQLGGDARAALEG